MAVVSGMCARDARVSTTGANTGGGYLSLEVYCPEWRRSGQLGDLSPRCRTYMMTHYYFVGSCGQKLCMTAGESVI